MTDQLKTFSQKLKRLEDIVSQLEKPDLELEDGLTLLEEGVKLHQECQHMLTQTQAKITTLLDAQSPGQSDSPAPEKPAGRVIHEQETLEASLFDVPTSGQADDQQKDNDDNDGLPF